MRFSGKLTIIFLSLFFFLSLPAFSQAAWLEQKITDYSGTTEYPSYPSIALDALQNIHLVWEQHKEIPAPHQIYYKKGANFGGSWDPDRNLTSPSVPARKPCITAGPAGKTYLVYENYRYPSNGYHDINFSKTNDAGINWSTGEAISVILNTGNHDPSILIGSGGNLHSIWENNYWEENEIMYKKSTNEGESWPASDKNLSGANTYSSQPAIARSPLGKIYVVWSQAENYEMTRFPWINIISSDDEGVSWSSWTYIVSSSASAIQPSVAADPSEVIHVVWIDNRTGTYSLWYKKSVDEGLNWSSDLKLNEGSGICSHPRIISDELGRLHLVWHDNRTGTDQIYYKTSFDSGYTWSSDARLSSGSGVARFPSVAAGLSGRVFVAWQDNSTGKFEIYIAQETNAIIGRVELNGGPAPVEIEASINGEVKGRASRVGSGAYKIGSIEAGTYSVEASAAGYEIKNYALPVVVATGETTVGIDFALNPAWPMFRQDKWHTGISPDTALNPPLILKWSFPTNGSIKSSPSVLDGTVYVGTTDMKLYAVNTDGTLKWSSEMSINRPILSSPAVSEGKLYLPVSNSTASYMYAMNNSDGSIIWSFNIGPAGNDLPSSATLANGLLYVGAGENIYAIYTSGALKWSLSSGGPGSTLYSTPAVADGTIYIGSNAGDKLFAIRDDGTIKWSFVAGGFLQSSPAVADGAVYVGSDDGKLYAIEDNGDSYSVRWSFASMGAIKSSPAVANGVVYVGSNDGKLYAINDLGGGYSIKWSFSTGGVVSSSPVLVNGFVCVGSGDNKLYVINAEDGTVSSSFETGGDVLSSPSVVDGVLYFGSSDGYLYALESVPPTSEGFQVSNLLITREADSVGSAVIISWDPTTEVDVYSTTEGYTSFEGWTLEGSTTNSYFVDSGQVGTGDREKYYKVVLSGVSPTAIGSADAVGKFNISVPAGYNLISVPLLPHSIGIASVIGNQLSGGIQAEADAVYDKIGVTSVYRKAYLSAGGAWIDAQTGGESTMGIDPQKGYFVYRKGPEAKTITLVGGVLDAPLVSTLEAGYSLIGTLYPKNSALNASGLELSANSGIQAVADAVYSKQGATSIYDKAYFNVEWLDASTGGPVSWKLTPGRGYFYERKYTEMEWLRTKPW